MIWKVSFVLPGSPWSRSQVAKSVCIMSFPFWCEMLLWKVQHPPLLALPTFWKIPVLASLLCHALGHLDFRIDQIMTVTTISIERSFTNKHYLYWSGSLFKEQKSMTNKKCKNYDSSYFSPALLNIFTVCIWKNLDEILWQERRWELPCQTKDQIDTIQENGAVSKISQNTHFKHFTGVECHFVTPMTSFISIWHSNRSPAALP